MAARKQVPKDIGECPNCASPVVYGGVGRRPIWCSTRCRNDASLKRLGARKAAVEVRIVEVFRQQLNDQVNTDGQRATRDAQRLDTPRIPDARAPSPTLEQALRVVRNDPEAVGSLLSHLERRRLDGTLAARQWLPVRNAIRLIAGELLPGIERPT
jgi:hypothetical protein